MILYKRIVRSEVNNCYAKTWMCLLFCKVLVSVERGNKSVCSVDVLSYCFVVAGELSHHQRLQVPPGMHCFYLETSLRTGKLQFFFLVFLLYPQLSANPELQ